MEKSIDYWKEIYTRHSQTDGYKRKVEKTVEILNEFFDLKIKSYGSISGGKDSTCIMDLLYKLDNNFQFVTEKDDMDFPEEIPYINSFIPKGYKIDIITPPIKLWDVINEYNFCEDIHSKGTNFSDQFFYGLLKKYQKDNEYKAVVLGLRAEESKGRLMNFKKNGHIYYNKTWHQIVCQPIAHWLAKDVFAYLFSENLPILPVYFMSKFVESPENIRKSWILPSAQTNEGQAIWLKYYYPELFQKLCKKMPKLRSYV